MRIQEDKMMLNFFPFQDKLILAYYPVQDIRLSLEDYFNSNNNSEVITRIANLYYIRRKDYFNPSTIKGSRAPLLADLFQNFSHIASNQVFLFTVAQKDKQYFKFSEILFSGNSQHINLKISTATQISDQIFRTTNFIDNIKAKNRAGIDPIVVDNIDDWSS